MRFIFQETDSGGTTWVTEFEDGSTAPIGGYAVDRYGNVMYSWRQPIIVEPHMIFVTPPVVSL